MTERVLSQRELGRAIFIFRGEPEEYNLPAVPDVSTVHLRSGWQSAAVAAGLMLAGVAAAFFTRD